MPTVDASQGGIVTCRGRGVFHATRRIRRHRTPARSRPTDKWPLGTTGIAIASSSLTVAKVVVLVSDQFEDAEFRISLELLRAAGRDVCIVGVLAGQRLDGRLGQELAVTDASIWELVPEQCIGVVVIGGLGARALATHPAVLKFLKCFHYAGRPLGAIGEGISVLLSAHIGVHCHLTSPPGLRETLESLGGEWVDERVVVHGHLVAAQSTQHAHEFAEAFVHCLAAAERTTSPLEVPPEMPPLF